MKAIDLNADIGEGLPWDRELLAIITSANVCCGAHAGSVELTHQTVSQCMEHCVRVGAHPGYPDRAGFGRKSVAYATPSALREEIEHQLALLGDAAAYIKPHGALYHDCAKNGPAFEGMRDLLNHRRLPLMGMAALGHDDLACSAGVPFLREGFAERGYDSEGKLLPRSEPRALLTSRQEIQDQALRLADQVDSLCIHGDSPGCVQAAEWVRSALESHGYAVRSSWD